MRCTFVRRFFLCLLATLLTAGALHAQELLQTPEGWRFGSFGEYREAHGSPSGQVDETEDAGKPLILLDYDFAAGGYVCGALAKVEIPEGTKAINFRVRSSGQIERLQVRLTDLNKRTFLANKKYTDVGDWQEFRVELDESSDLKQAFGGKDGAPISFPIRHLGLCVFAQDLDLLSGRVEFRDITLEQ